MAIAIPAKVIEVLVTSQTGYEQWQYDDGLGDPYWAGGTSPKYYKWIITATVTPQTHSSHLTREPYLYNGMDITVGNYIANSVDGIALKIIEITSKSELSITCIVEDVFRYNTYRSAGGLGTGIFSVPGSAIVFNINENGLPIIDPVPAGGVSSNFGINIQSRFQNFDIQNNFQLSKLNHGFVEGQVIASDTGNNTFAPADSTHSTVIGVVTYAGPGPNNFTIRPNNKIVETFDSLIGEVGDLIYADNTIPGGLTLTNNGKPQYIKLREFTQSQTTGTVIDATTASGNKIEINGVTFTIIGSGNIADTVLILNQQSVFTGVTASAAPAPTVIQTIGANISSTYGEPALIVGTTPASATINGVYVIFNISTVGMATYGASYALEEDMAEAINSANIPNIVATTNSNQLFITNMSGGSITISNINADDNGVVFAGFNSGSGLPLTSGTTSGSYLRLTAEDARAINLRNIVGTPIEDFGIISVENGIKAAAMVIEQGIRKGENYVVADIMARDNLSVLLGDTAFVLDTGEGEWGHFIFDGSSWVQLASYDSARTDAQSIAITLTFTDATGVYPIYRVSSGSRVLNVSVRVDIPFDSASATINIGDLDQFDRLLQNSNVDLTYSGSYENSSNYQYGGGSETQINAWFNPGGSTVGSATVTLTYV